MTFKPIVRLISLKKLISNDFRHCFPKNSRLFSTNYINIKQNSNDFYSNEKIKKVDSLLRDFDFNDKQIDLIFKRIGNYIIEEKDLTDNSIGDTIECWQSYLKPPKLRPKQLDKLNAEDIDYDMSVDFNHVVSKIEPKLLLINSNAIHYRINCIKDLSIIGGSRDLWRVFVYAPNGYYLQSWTDFLKKYHYINFRILEWLFDKKDKDKLHPHPLIRNAKVMELTFEEIRCRFLFAKRTGLKTISVKNQLLKVEDISKTDLRALLLFPIEKYLKLIAPNCSQEEYYALETLLNEMPAEEDEKIIEDMIELTASNKTNFKKTSNKRKDSKETDETNYQIITRIE